jgi:hypothetical protein
LIVQFRDALECRDHMAAEALPVADRIRDEEPPAQDLGDVVLEHRLNAFFALAPKDVVKVARDLLAERIALSWIGREQRCDHRRALDLGRRLGEVLEEVQQPVVPRRIEIDRRTREHQYLVNKYQSRQVLAVRQCEQLGQKVFRGRRLAFLFISFGVEQPKAFGTGDLKRHHAPRILEPSQLTPGTSDLHPFFRVELVERQDRDPRPGRLRADMLDELLSPTAIG